MHDDHKVFPYIGVTGFKTVKEVETLSSIIDELQLANLPHMAMFGFLCSNKRLANSLEGGLQSISVNDLPKLIQHVPEEGVPMLHYYTTVKENLAAEIHRLFDEPHQLSRNCHALQINMDWPLPKQVERIRQDFPYMTIVLQLPQKAIEEMAPKNIAKKCNDYCGLVQHILLDQSGGTGKNLDIEQTICIIDALQQELTGKGITLGIAGGLDNNNVASHIRAIGKKLGSVYFSVDAQGKLRTQNKESIDYELMRAYFTNAVQGFSTLDRHLYLSKQE